MVANALEGAFDAEKRKSMSWFQSKIEFFREYFNVTHSYVRWKLLFVLLPFLPSASAAGVSRTVSREIPQDDNEQTGHGSGIGLRLLPGRRPDLYIPLMGFLTYVLVYGLSKGKDFHPDDLYNISSLALVLGAVEVLVVKGAAYFLTVSTFTLTDIVAVCGYKFTNLSVSIIFVMVTHGMGRVVWIMLYIFAAVTAGLTVQRGLVTAGNFNSSNYMGESGSAATEKLLSLCAGGAQLLWVWILMPAFVYVEPAISSAFPPETTR
jgi:hypothetical protein